MNTFFSSIASDLKFLDYNNCEPLVENIQEPFLKAIVKYRNQPNILTSMQKKRSIQKNTQISFTCVDKGETLKDVLSLDASKACQVSVIPSRVIKENVDILTDFLHSSFNNSIYQSQFPPIFKRENFTPVFKKGGRNSGENHRPVSIVSNISKIFEQCMFCQISSFMNSYLSKQQCWFRKGYSIKRLQPVCDARKMEKTQ